MMKKTILSIACFLTILFAGSTLFATTYTFTGTGDWSEPTNWDMNNVPTSPLMSGDEIIINGNCTLDFNFSINSGASLTINSMGTLTTISDVTINGMFNNNGGILNINGIGSSFTINNEANNNLNAIINIASGASLNNGTGSTFANDGAINNSGVVNNDGTLDSDGTITITSTGTFNNDNTMTNGGTIDNAGTFNATQTDADVLTNTGTINNTNDMVSNGTINNNTGGQINNEVGGELINNNTFNNNGGTINNEGTFNAGSNDMDALNNFSGTINNSGSITSAGTTTNDGNVNNNGTITNSYIFNNNGVFDNNGTLINTGTFENGSTMTDMDDTNGTFNNHATGVVDNTGGVFNNNNDGFFTEHDDSEVIPMGSITGPGSILPIELLSFSGKRVSNSIQLHWRTATEQNNAYMEVQRSKDGKRFEALQQVLSKTGGNSTTPQDYTFSDEQPLAGVNYYRLRQVDFDGKEEFHNIIAVLFQDKASDQNITIFPTIVDHQLNIALGKEADSNGELYISDMNGRVLLRQPFDRGMQQYTWDLPELPQGTYVLIVKTGRDMQSSRFIKK